MRRVRDIGQGIRFLGMAVCLVVPCLVHAAGTARDSIVINEIMYHPPLDREDLQFVELFNRDSSSVDLSKWSFTKGITFRFPDRTILPAGGYLVVCRNRVAFAAHYGKDISVVGDFTGRLSHGGEKLQLADTGGNAVDEVSYADRDPWPTGPDGYSASLERICPFSTGNDPANWASSKLPPTEKAAGTPGRVNDSFSTSLPPVISNVSFKEPSPLKDAVVTAQIATAHRPETVILLYRVAGTGREDPDTEAPMQRVGGTDTNASYQASIKGQPEGTLVRFRIRAEDTAGAVRFQPSPNEPRPTYSFAVQPNTNTARIAFAYVLNISPPAGAGQAPTRGRRQVSRAATEPSRGHGAFIYVPPDGGAVQTFDHVQIRPRSGGFKVHFQRDRPLKGMTGINVIFEGSPRYVLAEPLAYELYRMAGVPAPATEHLRIWRDGRPEGYRLMIEQPNKSFLARHAGNDSGNLYKLIWQGRGIVGQHEKKTNPGTGHDDITAVINGLNNKKGAAQWEFIAHNFDVAEVVNYYAVNMCIQNWDGFWNNYYAYHDTEGSGKWKVYPWDEDKTWGDYDGTSSLHDWYEMPLTFGMNGDVSPRYNPMSRGNNQGGHFGGVAWWRPPGWFSGPLLANQEFRSRFLDRLGEICTNTFTEQRLSPLIDAMETRLEAEMAVHAQVFRKDAGQILRTFHDNIHSLRNQINHRREYILKELPAAKKELPKVEAEAAKRMAMGQGRPHGQDGPPFRWIALVWGVCSLTAIAAVVLGGGLYWLLEGRKRVSQPSRLASLPVPPLLRPPLRHDLHSPTLPPLSER